LNLIQSKRKFFHIVCCRNSEEFLFFISLTIFTPHRAHKFCLRKNLNTHPALGRFLLFSEAKKGIIIEAN